MEKVFESERINFVKVNMDLIDEYLKMVNDPDIASRIMHEKITFTPEMESEWIKTKLEENAPVFSMIEKTTGKYIGNTEIMSIEGKIGELGIAITHDMQDNHFGFEALTALMNYTRDALSLEGYVLNVHKDNPRAIHLYQKLGFEIDREGRTSEDWHMTKVR